MSQVAAGNYLL